MSRARKIADLLVNNKQDAANNAAALRFQAKAWRITALIAADDPARGVALSRWLFTQTVPFVNGEALENFIVQNEPAAEVAAYKSGVFDTPKPEERPLA